MFWLIAWVVVTLALWMYSADDREMDGKKPFHPLVSLALSAGFSVLILAAVAGLLSSPGLWNALSMGQR